MDSFQRILINVLFANCIPSVDLLLNGIFKSCIKREKLMTVDSTYQSFIILALLESSGKTLCEQHENWPIYDTRKMRIIF